MSAPGLWITYNSLIIASMIQENSSLNHKYGPWAMVAGASEGIGAAFAKSLAKSGFNLVLLARRPGMLKSLADEIERAFTVKIECLAFDLQNWNKLTKLVSDLNQDIGLLVYNAAYSPIGNLEEIPESDLIKAIDVNVKSPLLLIKTLIPSMIARKKGGIILMSSLSGAQGSPRIATYAATKSFNTILAEGLWKELGQKGIDVMVCCAGAVRTPGYLRSKSGKDAPGTLDPADIAESALSALGKGPVNVPGFTNKMARFVMGRLLPRKTTINIMYTNTKDLK